MKVKVLLPFSDKYNLARSFNPGEIVDFEDKRAHDIVSRGLGEFCEKESYEAPETKKVEETIPEPEKVEEKVDETPKVEEPEKVEEPTTEPEKAEEVAEETEKVEKKKPGRKPKNAESE